MSCLKAPGTSTGHGDGFLTASLYYKKNAVSTEIPWAEAKDIQTRTALPVLLQK